MNRRAMDVGMLIKILLWLVVIVLVFLFIKKYIVDADPTGPLDPLLG